VTIGAGAPITSETIDLAVYKCVKTAFKGSTLGAGALAVEAGCVNGRLRDEQRSDGEMPYHDPSMHPFSSSETRRCAAEWVSVDRSALFSQ